MPRFMAVHSIPVTEQQLTEMFNARSNFPSGVDWNQSFCDFGEGKVFCEWDAPNKEVIEALFKQSNLPYDKVYEVQRFDAKTGQLEK